MNELKELLDAIEKRAEAATFENWGRIARADVPALVKALKRAAEMMTWMGKDSPKSLSAYRQELASLLKRFAAMKDSGKEAPAASKALTPTGRKELK